MCILLGSTSRMSPQTIASLSFRFQTFSVLSGFKSSVEVEVTYCDFEVAVIAAYRRHFSQARIQGCFFHLCQSVYRRLCKLGMQARHCQDEDFAVQLNTSYSLSLKLSNNHIDTLILYSTYHVMKHPRKMRSSFGTSYAVAYFHKFMVLLSAIRRTIFKCRIFNSFISSSTRSHYLFHLISTVCSSAYFNYYLLAYIWCINSKLCDCPFSSPAKKRRFKNTYMITE